MFDEQFDIIVIGAGSAGLSVGLFMNRAGFRVLMISRSDRSVGGDCLNEGCVPSKALIHAARMFQNAREAENFGVMTTGKADIGKVIRYIRGRQDTIRQHESARWLRGQGIIVELGDAFFSGERSVTVNGKVFTGRNIVIATGSVPKQLSIPGVENVKYYDNRNIFGLDQLPERFLFIGGGPISTELAQAMKSLGSQVTLIHRGDMILPHDDKKAAAVLLRQLREQHIRVLLGTEPLEFPTPNTCLIRLPDGSTTVIGMDAVFAGIGRELLLDPLNLAAAGIAVKDGKIVTDPYLRTTNPHVFVCGDIAGDLKFSHAAEFHARILLNNFFNPFRKKLDNRYMSWVTFTSPELATFGMNEKQLQGKDISFLTLEQDFSSDDRAVVDSYPYGYLKLYIGKGGWFRKQKILGGTMVAPHAGEMIQELMLANSSGLDIKAIFNKVYPYPVASRVNQHLIVQLKKQQLTPRLSRLLQRAYKIFS